VVDTFVCLGSSVNASGGNDSDIRRRIVLARTCMKSLDRGIWRSSISLVTKLRLYNVYILPVLLYGSDTWSVTEASRQRLGAFDQWCLRRILRVPYTTHYQRIGTVTNRPTPGFLANTTTPPQAVWAYSSGCSLRGRLTCAIRASTNRLPVDWCRPRGRPRQSWLRTIESDLKSLNLGLHSALRRATDRPSWRRVVETAMLCERATR